MATPMTAAQVVAQLKKWGLRYVEIPGWSSHNRNQKGAWGPVNGFVWHHTGADVRDGQAYASTTLYNGITGLPGPLCQFSIGTDGTVYLVGWGRANHAGGGDPAVLAHVQAEDYSGQLHPTRGNSNGVDGNAHFYGVEIQYSGGHEMSAAQYTAARRLSAAILDFHGWSERSVIGHGEWSSDKWDPGYAAGKIMAMPAVRADVASTLSAGPNTQQEETVALTAADLEKIRKVVWESDKAAAPKDAPDAKTNPTWQYQSYLKDTNARVRAIQVSEAAQTAAIAKLAGLAGSGVDTATVVAAVKEAIADAVVKVSVDVTGADSKGV
ncbi:peptidoglycan recognition family protein [Streptomyces sp. SCL15-4]|uniref:peptidoglycan recognition protein family protein n=1 Tax=Streptomyces sp. SCL15-4 TaxID=2967221 RepID=UPI0029676F34|nr:peptidoglycan recognition family protein [Streptomyces sp. SCL15-4]